MCNHQNREAAMVVVVPGTPERHGRDGVWCDPCLVPIVKALNDGGVRTVSSCCGHGSHYGGIALADGRWLVIAPDMSLLGPLRKAESVVSDEPTAREAAIRDLVRAVLDEGRSPYWHHTLLARHHAEAPVVWAAIDRLVREESKR